MNELPDASFIASRIGTIFQLFRMDGYCRLVPAQGYSFPESSRNIHWYYRAATPEEIAAFKAEQSQ